jgi:hypothetical protein
MASVDSLETTKVWRTPLPKLVRFFHDSRAKWKQKYAESSKKNKLLSNQVRAVEQSREQWRQLAGASPARSSSAARGA